MSRNANASLVTALSGNAVNLILMVDITFSSGTQYVWSGVGDLTYNGNTYVGVGDFGGIGDIQESTKVLALGTTLTLSGIDTALLNDCLSDIQIGAPVNIYLGALDDTGAIVGTPYIIFGGTVDKPSIQTGPKTVAISLGAENKLYNQSRATCRRYTSADQRRYYPTDIAFQWVPSLNNRALRWGG